MDANQLRRAFIAFFEQRGHTPVPSSSLIPHDPDLLFTVAGMVPFKPYFLGDERPPYTRATSVQRCLRAGGKDSDLEEVGRDDRHLSLFEMLGNFSFGDYFKAEAIPMAWEMVTELFGLDPDRLWITCHHSDDEAAVIWRDVVGVAPDRIQRLGADNWWGPPGGPTGPCGPCSEIYVDKGPDHGADGGPANGADDRYLEIWNLVFMQFNRQLDGTDVELPRKNIDTGAGLERILTVLQGVDSVFEIDAMAPLVETAQRVTGTRLGADPRSDVSLRILAEHARGMTFLVSDGVLPSNEERGYVLRRIIRRAVRHAFLLGVEHPVTPELVQTTVDVMGEAYPELVQHRDFVVDVVTREEARFRQTLRSGSGMLDDELDAVGAGGSLSGTVAFRLHDTYGFPLEVTQEVAAERGVAVDVAGFEAAMAEQRTRAKEARKGVGGTDPVEVYRELLEQFGTTEFTGSEEHESKARVIGVVPREDDVVEIFLDRTPFYAESGGQVGDTGSITSETGVAEVLDTTLALPGLHRHVAKLREGEISVGQEAVAAFDVARRDAVRRNHTGTHVLHWALRQVLGDHVKQQGSYVAPDHLRFDFSHHAAVSPEDLERVEDLANGEVLANDSVRAYETTKEHAGELGAIAFFGDKYGDIVRVLEAGRHSVELCGGTHVRALGDIGPVKITSEGSIGANQRRIFAVTGTGALEHVRREERVLTETADLLGVPSAEVAEGVRRRLEELKGLRDELKGFRRQAAGSAAVGLAGQAVDGVVVARCDDVERDELRDLAVAVRDQPGVRAVVLGGASAGGGAALVAAVTPDAGLVAFELIADAARTVQGGGGRNPDLAVAGGKDASRIDEALDQARAAANVPGLPIG